MSDYKYEIMREDEVIASMSLHFSEDRYKDLFNLLVSGASQEITGEVSVLISQDRLTALLEGGLYKE